ncbi:MAG: DUF362 domain-containing protein [Candidatus Thorarchaeota archaeon]|nr:MAG: DUF362 domain-containing protein [Candidatus Thorarchaeota archaeon]
MNSSSPYIRDGKFLVSKTPVGENLKSAIRTAVDLIGGFDKVISQNDVVTIKPNLNTADPYPASSDPMFIKALGELLLDAGAGKLKIIESSTMRLSARKVSDTVGLTAVANELDAELIFLDEHAWVKVDIPRGKYLKRASIGKPLIDMGKLVLAPCLKTHFIARYTGSMKLFVGWIKHRERIRLHMKNLEPKIADLASYFNPDLIVMDARTCFITNGPASGQCSSPNLILASGDMVSIDVEGVRTIQCCNAKNKLDMDVWEIPQIRRAVEIGIGAQSDSDIEIVS